MITLKARYAILDRLDSRNALCDALRDGLRDGLRGAEGAPLRALGVAVILAGVWLARGRR